jgi:hypothetical protein
LSKIPKYSDLQKKKEWSVINLVDIINLLI